jgi:Mg2+ and Co2+ transporter CorA
MTDPAPNGPPRTTLFNDLIYWAKQPNAFGEASSNNSAPNIHLPIQAILRIICAEWLTIADYIKTRLGQIEWEIAFPEHFISKHANIDLSLRKLHVWRRLVPIYREMLTENLRRVSHFPCCTPNLVGSGNGLGSTNGNIASESTSNSASTDYYNNCKCALYHSAPVSQCPASTFHDEFARVLSSMVEYQQRVDRLTSVVTATISIADSRRALKDSMNNQSVTQLTWLAAFYIPLNFISSLFSMQGDISSLQGTFKLYFTVALPLAVGGLVLAKIMGSA